MSRRLSYTPEARDDLTAIRRWLTQPGSGATARRLVVRIRNTINDLRRHPYRGTFGNNPVVRELPCPGGYRALYQLRPDTGDNETAGDIRIIRIFGPGQSRERF